jgi:hypothetical protein
VATKMVTAQIGVTTNDDGTYSVEIIADGKPHMQCGPFDDHDVAMMVARELAKQLAAAVKHHTLN